MVVPCTKSKSQPVAGALHFGALVPGGCEAVAGEWLAAAKECEAPASARALYSGIGWSYALRAEQLAGDPCELWVISAGFGLVSGDEALPAYAATFAAEENRVGNQLSGFRSSNLAHAAWWGAINTARGRTQSPLCSTFRDYDRVIIALSAPYLAAVRADLELLAGLLGPQKLWIMAVGVDARTLAPELGECVVPLTIEVEKVIASPRATLNLRALLWWIEEIVPVAGWNRAAQAREIRRRLCEVAAKAVRVGQPMRDDEVAHWVEARRAQAGGQWPRGGKTGLLQSLRASGRACEQKRFSRICDQVVARR